MIRIAQFVHCLICCTLLEQKYGGGGGGIPLNMEKKQQKKLSHELRATKKYYHKVEVWEMGHKENSHEKVSQSLILMRTQVLACTNTHTPRTHGHQVFIVLLLMLSVYT